MVLHDPPRISSIMYIKKEKVLERYYLLLVFMVIVIALALTNLVFGTLYKIHNSICVRLYIKSEGVYNYTFAAPMDLSHHQLILKQL